MASMARSMISRARLRRRPASEVVSASGSTRMRRS